MIRPIRLTSLLWLAVAIVACGDGATEADEIGVGAECAGDGDCLAGQSCLAFSGGYCGLTGCAGDVDCPEGAACIAHVDGQNYCFRICLDKAECNYNRSPANESNCSANVEFVDGKGGAKACVPPSG